MIRARSADRPRRISCRARLAQRHSPNTSPRMAHRRSPANMRSIATPGRKCRTESVGFRSAHWRRREDERALSPGLWYVAARFASSRRQVDAGVSVWGRRLGDVPASLPPRLPGSSSSRLVSSMPGKVKPAGSMAPCQAPARSPARRHHLLRKLIDVAPGHSQAVVGQFVDQSPTGAPRSPRVITFRPAGPAAPATNNRRRSTAPSRITHTASGAVVRARFEDRRGVWRLTSLDSKPSSRWVDKPTRWVDRFVRAFQRGRRLPNKCCRRGIAPSSKKLGMRCGDVTQSVRRSVTQPFQSS